jgi:hypothetical protein
MTEMTSELRGMDPPLGQVSSTQDSDVEPTLVIDSAPSETSYHVAEGVSTVDEVLVHEEQCLAEQIPEELKVLRYLSVMQRNRPRNQWGAALSPAGAFYEHVRQKFVQTIPVSGIPIDFALRRFLLSTSLPAESQSLERLVHSFASHYERCNPKLFSEGIVESIMLALLLANTVFFNPSARKNAPSRRFWIKNFTDTYKIPSLLAKILYHHAHTVECCLAKDDPGTESWITDEECSGPAFSSHTLPSLFPPNQPVQSMLSLLPTKVHQNVAASSLYELVFQGHAATILADLDLPEVYTENFASISQLPIHQEGRHLMFNAGPLSEGEILLPTALLKLVAAESRRSASKLIRTADLPPSKSFTSTLFSSFDSSLSRSSLTKVLVVKRGFLRPLASSWLPGFSHRDWYMILSPTYVCLWNKSNWVHCTEFANKETTSLVPPPTWCFLVKHVAAIVDRTIQSPNSFRLVLGLASARQGQADEDEPSIRKNSIVQSENTFTELLFQVSTEYEVWDWVSHINSLASLRQCNVDNLDSHYSAVSDHAVGKPSHEMAAIHISRRSSDPPTPSPQVPSHTLADIQKRLLPNQLEPSLSSSASSLHSISSGPEKDPISSAPIPISHDVLKSVQFNHVDNPLTKSLENFLRLSSRVSSNPVMRASFTGDPEKDVSASSSMYSETRYSSYSTIPVGIFNGRTSPSTPTLSNHDLLLKQLLQGKSKWNQQRKLAKCSYDGFFQTYLQLSTLAPVQPKYRRRASAYCHELSRHLRTLAMELAMLDAFEFAIDIMLGRISNPPSS